MRRGPLITLVAALGLALVLLVVNRAATDPTSPAGLAAPGEDTSRSTSAEPSPAPSPTPSPTVESATGPAPRTQFPEHARYVGDAETAAGPVPVAVTVDGDRAKAYVCDNRSIEAWLQGTARDGEIDAAGKGPNRLHGRLDGGRLTGTVLVAGHPEWTFSVAPATGDRSGVYRRSAGGTTTGWIVRGDGRQVGLRHDASGAVAPAAPLPVDAQPASALPPGVRPVDADTDVLAD